MRHHRTYKRKNRKSRKTYRRRYGGNNESMNGYSSNGSQISIENASGNFFDQKKNNLKVTLYSLGDLFTRMVEEYNTIEFDINSMFSIVQALNPVADEIDAYYGDNEMEDLVNEIIGDINEAFPNNNNETVVMGQNL